MALNHAFTSAVADGADATLVRPSNWNADHVVSGTSLQLLFNNAGSLTGMSGTSWDDTNRSLTLTGATLAGVTSFPVLNLVQTWNNAATAFTAYQFNVVNTASAATSLLFDFQVGGTSRFAFAPADNLLKIGVGGGLPYLRFVQPGVFENAFFFGAPSGTGFSATAGGFIGFYNADTGITTVGNVDVRLNRDAANILAQRNGTNAQTLRVYNTYTDASNYERGVFDWTTTANTLTIETQVGGTGNANRNMNIGVTQTVASSGTLTLYSGSTGPLNLMALGNTRLQCNSIVEMCASFGYGNTVVSTGGTVTQLTSKSTGVTLSKQCGQITMNAAALTADTTVSFVLTNTNIAATDVLILNHVSGGTPGSYTLNAQCAAGSATINVRNITTGSLSEAIVIAFVLVKAVNA